MHYVTYLVCSYIIVFKMSIVIHRIFSRLLLALKRLVIWLEMRTS